MYCTVCVKEWGFTYTPTFGCLNVYISIIKRNQYADDDAKFVGVAYMSSSKMNKVK